MTPKLTSLVHSFPLSFRIMRPVGYVTFSFGIVAFPFRKLLKIARQNRPLLFSCLPPAPSLAFLSSKQPHSPLVHPRWKSKCRQHISTTSPHPPNIQGTVPVGSTPNSLPCPHRSHLHDRSGFLCGKPVSGPLDGTAAVIPQRVSIPGGRMDSGSWWAPPRGGQ